MAAPVRQTIVDQRYPEANWKALGPAQVWTRRLYFSQFAIAGLTANLDIAGFIGGTLIEGAFALFNVNWTGGAVATATISVGTTATPTAYIAATSVFSGATKTAPLQLVGVTLVPGTFLNATTPLAAGTVRVQLITTVGNTNVLTAGQLDLYLRLRIVSLRTS